MASGFGGAFDPQRRVAEGLQEPEDDNFNILFGARKAGALTPAPLAAVPDSPSRDAEPEVVEEGVAPTVKPITRRKSKPGTPAYVHRDLQLWLGRRKGELAAQRGTKVTITDIFLEALESVGEDLGVLFRPAKVTSSGMPLAPKKPVVSGGVQISLSLIDAQEQWLDARAAEFEVSRSAFVSAVLEWHRAKEGS